MWTASTLTYRLGKQLNPWPGNKYGSVPCKGMCRGEVTYSLSSCTCEGGSAAADAMHSVLLLPVRHLREYLS